MNILIENVSQAIGHFYFCFKDLLVGIWNAATATITSLTTTTSNNNNKKK